MLSSSKLSSRPRSQQTMVLRTLLIRTDFRCRCACTPVRWSHLGRFFRLIRRSQIFLCFGGLSDCQIYCDCAFCLNSKRTACRPTDVFWCLCCLRLCSLSPKRVCRFLPASESDFRFSVFLFLLSSSCFIVLSATFTSWIVAPYLLHATYMRPVCNFICKLGDAPYALQRLVGWKWRCSYDGRHYKQAYGHIMEQRMHDTNMLEIKTIAGFVNYKVSWVTFTVPSLIIMIMIEGIYIALSATQSALQLDYTHQNY